MNEELKEYLEKDGYFDVKEIPGRGVCALKQMMFTTGLFYGMTECGYKGRYCFSNTGIAMASLSVWDGKDHPLGNWIKHKGFVEFDNPNLNKDSSSFSSSIDINE